MVGVGLVLTLLGLVSHVEGDVYMHNPRGSNNRLNGQNRNRQNNNRLFDSQNNNRGGYNVGDTGQIEGAGSLTYIGGSLLNIQWTNQHECGGSNTGCDIILQYMCNGNIRDGTNTGTPQEQNDNPANGRHETQDYYKDCKARQRNHGYYHADQKLNGHSARYTRQNNNGGRSGLECPEERDYYPYHHPTQWKDIVILTNNVQRCELYKNQSQNVQAKGYCKFPTTAARDFAARHGQGNGRTQKARLAPITKADCDSKGAGMTWTEVPAWGLPAPQCLPAPHSRDNHLGNTEPSGQANTEDMIPKTLKYTWKLPDIDEEACILRIRYNISIGDYDQFAVDENNDRPRSNECLPTLDIGSSYGLGPKEAKARGYELKNDPKIKPFKNIEKLDFQLALNTAQTGRVFQDRSHKFRITRKKNVPSCPEAAPVHNLNVIGKRGNIVQVYPAVEYGFEPAILKVNTGHCIHAQWTGSLRNPNNNDGEGRNGEDKSNIIAMTPRKYKTNQSPANTLGHSANSYPLKISTQRFLDVDTAAAQKMAFPTSTDSKALPVGRTAIEVIGATASSTFQGRTNLWGPLHAINGNSPTNVGFFHSNWEFNPWLRVEIKPTTLSSITIVNRRDGGGERLKNVEVRAGSNPNLTGNPIVGTFKGPGYTKGLHTIPFQTPVANAKYVTIQIKDRSRQILQINGLEFNAVDLVKSHGCVKEQGFCVKSNGRDQNSGVIKLDSVDGSTKEAQQSCLDRCRQRPGATGCEVIWNQGNRGCYVHTQEVARGNGYRNHACWVFSRCVDVTRQPAAPAPAAPNPAPSPAAPAPVATRVAYITSSASCWWRCGRKRGPCDGFCGQGQYCCRKNMGNECPAAMKAVAPSRRSRCIGYKTASQACRPTRGPKAGEQCVFPFKDSGKTCPGPKCCNTDNDSKGSWCSTKVDAAGNHISGNYAYCAGSSCDPATGKKDQSPGDNIQVAVPVTVDDDTQPEVSEDENQNLNDVVDQVESTLELADQKMTEILETFDDEVVGEIEKRGQNGDAAKLDYAPAYVNIAPIQVSTCKTYNYLCTRNNNFSNRSQKGKVIVSGC